MKRLPFLALFLLYFCGFSDWVSAQEIRELWVPSDHLKTLLKEKPRAVFLTPEQYEALIKDVNRASLEEEKIKPPVPATVRSVSMTGTIQPGTEVVPVTAEYEVQLHTDEWTEVPIVLPLSYLGSIEIDEKSALRTPGKSSILLTHGKGLHKVKTVFHLPVTRSPGGEFIEIHSPETPSASLTLAIPGNSSLTSDLPFHIENQQAKFTVPSQKDGCWKIQWAAEKVASIPGAALFQNCSFLYTVDSSKIQADLGMVLNSSLTDVPNRFVVSLPGESRLLSVEGSELQRWNRKPNGEVEIFLLPGDRETADLRLRAEIDAPPPGPEGEISVILPIARVNGIHRASGTLTVLGSEDIKIRQIGTGPLTVPIPDDREGPAVHLPNYVASFQFPVLQDPPTLSFAGIRNRFSTQLDTLITLNRETVSMARSALYLPIEGNLFETEITLADDEEIVSISCPEREDFSWKEDNATISLRWDSGLTAATPVTVKIETRRDPENWFQLSTEPIDLQFESIEISGAESLSGYVAVAFDSSFQVLSNQTTGLSPRDGRNTPVTGNLAWFRLEDFSLDLEASRKPAEIDVVNIAYALPLANTLEIEGQLTLEILHSGIREIQISAPAEVSQHLRFDSPWIAQQNRDEETGTWTVTFHEEQNGTATIRYRMSIPLEITGDTETEGEKKFDIEMPNLSIPAARRMRGEWVMEANTDTELQFTTENLDSVDSLRVSPIDGYKPRHRIISAFQYRGDDWQLGLSGTRHPRSELVSTVIDDLRIDTVLSIDGQDRHQARIAVRSAGDQFLEIKLPTGAVLWSLSVDGEREKPVRSGKDRLRVPLPANEDSRKLVAITLIYETPGKTWKSAGRESLQPVTFPPAIPVLQSNWQLHLPEGFDYQRFDTNLQKDFSISERLLLGHVMQTWMKNRKASFPVKSVVESNASEMWYRAFMAQEEADKLEQNGEFLEAMVKANEARSEYMNIRNQYPQFQPDAVTHRLTAIDENKRRLKSAIQKEFESEKVIPQIATNYVIRMQESVRRADDAALRGSQLMADGDFEGSVEQYNNAIDLLPDAPMTAQRRRAYIRQYTRAATTLARQYADAGRYNDAMGLIEDVLRPGIAPESLPAKRLIEQMNDPEYYSPALTPQHLERIRKVKLALKTAQGYLDYGDYDRAEREYHRTLNIDRYNSAARRSLEDLERHKLNYYDTARDQTRASFLRQIAEEWELPVPTAIDAPDMVIGENTATREILRNEEKLKYIRIPSVEFSDTPLRDALQFLQQRSVELDFNEPDVNRKGINIILSANIGSRAPGPPSGSGGDGFGFEGGSSTERGGGVGDTPITLRLTNVPLGEALRYTTNLAQLKYKVESHAVVVVPLSTPDADLFTNQYTVPPTFLNSGSSGGGGAAAADPFAAAPSDPGIQRLTAKQILENAGITFPPGSTAIYNPTTGKLIIKNTPDQMDLVESYIDAMKAGPEPEYTPGSVYKLPDESEQNAIDEANLKVEEKLQTIRIPSLEFSETPLEDALNFLQSKTAELDFAEADSSRKGVDIAISPSIVDRPPTAPTEPNGFGFEGGQPNETIGNVRETPITLRLNNVPLGEALRYTANLAQLRYTIQDGKVVVLPRGTPDASLTSSTYVISPEIHERMMAANQLPGGDPFAPEPQSDTPTGPDTPKQAMESAGITFPPGADVSYDPSTGKLSVTNTPDQSELVEAWLSSLDEGRPIIELQPKNADQFPETESLSFIGNTAMDGTVLATPDDLPKLEELFTTTESLINENRTTLESATIGNIDFSGKSVDEAMQLLESAIKDTGAQSASLRISYDTADEAAKKKILDFSMAKATAIEVLEKITGETDTRYYVTKSGIVIADQNTDIQPMETVFLPMPARVFQTLNDDGSIHDHHARSVLTSAGITFPRGSSAAYNPASGRLAVRNTKENIEAVMNQFATEMKAVAENPGAPENDLRFSSAYLGGASKLKGFRVSDVGRLPIAFDLPQSGRVYQFHGLYAPDSLKFRYVTWDRQIRVAWFWIAVGIAAFLFGAWKVAQMPVFLGVFIAVFLSFLPLVAGSGWAPFSNALLIGWLIGLAGWLIYKIVGKITPRANWCIWLMPLLFTTISAKAETHTAYVPYDPEKPVSEQDATRYYLDYETFTRLWKKVKEYRGESKAPELLAAKPGHAISTSLYKIASTPEKLVVNGRLTVAVWGDEWQKVPLKFSGVGLSAITLNGSPAAYQNGSVAIGDPGNHLIEVTFEIPFEKGQDQAAWSIPKSSATLLQISMESDVAEPVLGDDLPLAKSNSAEGTTLYTAAIGQQEKISFRRRLKTSGRGMTRPNSAVIDTRLFVAQGIEQLDATYDLRFPGQEDNRFSIAFENSFTPVRFDIPNLSLWEIKNKPGTNLRELTFFLTQPVSDSLQVKFTGERLINSEERTFPRLSAEAGRVEQKRHLLRADGLTVKVNPGSNHRQIPATQDNAGFYPVASYSLTGANENLNYSLAEKRAKKSAEVSYVYQLGNAKLETIAQFQIRSPEAPLLSFVVTLPENSTIQRLQGNRIRDWWRTGNDLHIRFSGGTPEVTALLLYLSETIEDSEDQFTLPISGFPIEGFEDDEVSGEGLVVAHTTRDISLNFGEERRVVRETGIDEVARDFEVLPPMEKKRGFRFERMAFTSTITSTKLDPRFHSLYVMLARVHESWVQLSIHTDLEVTRSGLDRFTFQTAMDVPVFQIPEDDIREVRITEENDFRTYEVIFQQFVTDGISFTMETGIPHGGTISLPDIEIDNGDRTERYIIVENMSPEQMEIESDRLDKTVSSSLPYKPDTLASAQIFRARPDWSLDIELENLETTAGNDAVILYAELTSAFRTNGEEWLKAVYHIQNRSLQFLPVAAPENSDLVSVVVSDTEVRADRGKIDGKDVVLVPLIQTKPGQLAYDVQMVFRSQSKKGRIGKSIHRTLDDPAVFGPTVEKTMWKVHLPAGHELADFKGNMQPIDEETSKLRKLQSDLSELKGLNYYSTRTGNDAQSRQVSNTNAEALAERIEETLKQVNQSGDIADEISRELEQQKIVITENRIEMPAFEVKPDQTQMPVDWMDNSGDIKVRNKRFSEAVRDQTRRLESQIRLNDNISVGNDFFNSGTIQAESKEEKSILGDNRYAQIGRLQQSPQSGKLQQKLSELNSVQNFEQVGAGKKKATPEKSKVPDAVKRSYNNARSAFRQIGHGGTAATAKEPANQPAPDPFGGEPDPFGGGNDAPADPFAPVAEPATQSVPGTVQNRTRYTPQAYQVQSGQANTFGDAFRAKGGHSVRVDFPVEGRAFHFQKLKDHAELEIRTKVKPDSGRLSAIFGMLALMGLIVVAKVYFDTVKKARA